MQVLADELENAVMTQREQLRNLIRERALMEGDFTLASGKRSRFYLDGKRVMFHPEGLLLIADAFLDAMNDCRHDSVGGLEMGAIPIAAAIALRSAQIGSPVPAFFVRKSAKKHGTKQFLEGYIQAGSHVVICDDVITTGGSAFQAIAEVERFGCTVSRVICLVNREDGAVAEFASRGYDYRPIYSLSELTEHVSVA